MDMLGITRLKILPLLDVGHMHEENLMKPLKLFHPEHQFRQQALPKSSFGTAVNYCIRQHKKLEAFLMDGRLEISNNVVKEQSNLL